jgi:hypothetical protein
LGSKRIAHIGDPFIFCIIFKTKEMKETIDRYLRKGWSVGINQHSQLVISEPETGKFFTLNGVVANEREHLIERKKQKYGAPVRTRFIH